jgi:hypothetical protein
MNVAGSIFKKRKMCFSIHDAKGNVMKQKCITIENTSITLSDGKHDKFLNVLKYYNNFLDVFNETVYNTFVWKMEFVILLTSKVEFLAVSLSKV